MSSIVLGVSGGIAAYKAALLLRLFTEAGHDVRVVPTESALEFVGAATWEALSGNRVQTGVFDHVEDVPHVALGQQADLVVVVPATANTLARAAHGLADDLLTNTLLTARCPIVMAPAMHTEMWEHPATASNVATLRSRGVHIVDPAVGRLTGEDTGAGRLPEPEAIFAYCQHVFEGRGQDLAGTSVVVSAGGTREPLDPVRYLANRSSGRQGYALAGAAAARGARVTVVAANVDLTGPLGVDVIEVSTTEELRTAMVEASKSADAIVMAAAPADFRPTTVAETKVKKSDDGSAPVIDLAQTPDILLELVQNRSNPAQIIVGFAAETGDAHTTVIDHATAKFSRKGCDLLVVNDVSGNRAFGQDDNEVTILSLDADPVPVARASKVGISHSIWDEVVQRLK